jgi:hypothetical protein
MAYGNLRHRFVPLKDVNLNVGSAPHMVAKTMLLQRKDTTQLEASAPKPVSCTYCLTTFSSFKWCRMGMYGVGIQ